MNTKVLEVMQIGDSAFVRLKINMPGWEIIAPSLLWDGMPKPITDYSDAELNQVALRIVERALTEHGLIASLTGELK